MTTVKALNAVLKRSKQRLQRRWTIGIVFAAVVALRVLVACSAGTAATPAKPVNVLLYGNSIMWASSDLTPYLPAGSTVSNRGVRSQTALEAELGYSVLPGVVPVTGKPFAQDMKDSTADVVVLAFGENEANRVDQHIPAAEFMATLQRLKDQAPGKVVIVETPGPISTPEPAPSLVAAYLKAELELARDKDWMVCDLASEVVRLFPSWYADTGYAYDGVHPSVSIQNAKVVARAKCIYLAAP